MEGNRQALIPKSKNNAPKTRRRGRLSFSPKTSVRNQYEEGTHVEHVNYNVNATKNINMPGYVMHSPHFKPHSKSSLQTSITEMERLRQQKMAENTARQFSPWTPRQLNDVELNSLTTGWQPAVSSVGSEETSNMHESYSNLALMRNTFGNAWTNAEIRREEIILEKNQVEAEALSNYDRKLSELEARFYQKYGIVAPSVLKRTLDTHHNELQQQSMGRSLNTYHDNIHHWTSWYNQQMSLIPAVVKLNYNKHIQKITKEYEQIVENALNKAEANLEKIKKGKAYPPYVKKTLANRLRNAKAVHNAFV